MRLSGSVDIGVSREGMRAALQSPAILAALLPGEVEMEPDGPGNYRFLLKKSLGPLEIHQRGTVEVRVLDGDHIGLAVKSAHKLGGKVEIATVIELTQRPRGTRIGYDGSVVATGLAARLLRDRAERVQPYLQTRMHRLKAEIEGNYAG